MAKSTALLVTTPGGQLDHGRLEQRFHELLGKLGARETDVIPCPLDHGGPPWLSLDECDTLVVGWGQAAPPDWDGIFARQLAQSQVRHLLVFDLTDDDWAGRFPMRRCSGRSRSAVISSDGESQFTKFVQGGFPVNPVPYAYRRKERGGPGDTVIVPIPSSESDDVSIVRLIFDLFVNGRMSRVDIANMLNAEGVEPPPNNASWTSYKVEGILSDPVYFGAGRYKGYLRMNTFPGIIDEALFWAAWVRVLSEKRPAMERTGSTQAGTAGGNDQSKEKLANDR